MNQDESPKVDWGRHFIRITEGGILNISHSRIVAIQVTCSSPQQHLSAAGEHETRNLATGGNLMMY